MVFKVNTTTVIGETQPANTVLAGPDGTVGVAGFRSLNPTDIPDLTLDKLPDAWIKKSVKAATTASITLSGTQTIDGVALVAGDRVLVKNQATSSQNGIYVVASGAWSRAADANVSAEIAACMVGVDQGTTNGGLTFDTNFKSTDTLGSTAMTWSRILDTASIGSSVQAWDADLDSIAGLAGTSGFLKKTADNTWSLDTNTYALTNQTMFIGTTSVAINRASGNLSLTGISSIAMPGSSSGTVTLSPPAAAGTTTITFPATTGTIALRGDTTYVGTTAITLNRGSGAQSLTGITSIDGYAADVAGGAANQILYQTAANATSYITAPTVSSYLQYNGSTFTWSNPSSGVTSISAGAGMNFTTITSTGTVTMGTPSTLTTSTSNQATGTTHTHAVTFPNTITSVNGQSSGAVSVPNYVKAWVNFNGSAATPVISGQFNVTSIGDRGVGLYTVNFQNTIGSSIYAVCGTSNRDGTNSTNPILCVDNRSTATPPSGTAVDIVSERGGGPNDQSYISVAIIRT